jgi:hypothetical protein
MEYAYLETFGRLSRIDINFPNVELPDDMPGFLLTNDDLHCSYNVRGAGITGGDPAFAVNKNYYQFTGGNIGASGPAIAHASGIPKLVVSGMTLSGGTAVDLRRCRLAVTGCTIHASGRGIVLDQPTTFSITGNVIRGIDNAAIKVTNSNDGGRKTGAMISALATRDVAGDGEHPIVIENSDDVQVSSANIVTSAGVDKAAVSVTDSQNVALGDIHGVDLSALLTHSNATFADTDPTP